MTKELYYFSEVSGYEKTKDGTWDWWYVVEGNDGITSSDSGTSDTLPAAQSNIENAAKAAKKTLQLGK